ncbi:ABC transporter permease [Clostridium sp. DJ247]|nr:ABC transporter permease [Clostridium sp. DJ247]
MKYGNKYLTIEIFITLGTFTALLLAWYFTTKFKVISDTLLPSPAKVLKSFNKALFQGYKDTPLLKHLADSMFRLLSSYGFAVLTGIPLGLASGYNSKIRAVFDPLVEFYQSLPPLAYYSILIIWLGIGDFSKIVLLFLSAFAPIFIASMSGVKSVREDFINGAYTLGAGKGQTFIHVIFPASLPYVFTGLRTSMASAYGTLVAAEMVAGVTGIGWMVSDASRFLRTDIIFMGIIVMGITSVILDRTIRRVESKVVPWKGKL